MKFETTLITSNEKYGVVLSPFETEKEAKLFARKLKKIIEDYIRNQEGK